MLSLVPCEAWDELPPDVQRKIGSLAIAMILSDGVTADAPEEGRWIGEDLRRKTEAELRRHVVEAGLWDFWPVCWSFLSDEERELL